jgi:hypothetical protein
MGMALAPILAFVHTLDIAALSERGYARRCIHAPEELGCFMYEQAPEA